MGAICCHGNTLLIQSARKPNAVTASQSPNPMMVYIKLDQDWPANLEIFFEIVN